MKVGNLCRTRAGMRLDDLANLSNDRMIHLAVQQHLARFPDQPARPDGNQRRADDAHNRVKPRPTPQQATGKCGDGQHRGCGIRKYMHVGRFEIQIVVMIGMILRMVVRLFVMMVCPAQYDGAKNVDG